MRALILDEDEKIWRIFLQLMKRMKDEESVQSVGTSAIPSDGHRAQFECMLSLHHPGIGVPACPAPWPLDEPVYV